MKNTKWVITDPDCNQRRKQIDNTAWLFEEDRIINPSTGVVKKFRAYIDLDCYSENEISDTCNSFGYDEFTVGKWLKSKENLDLIAECLFEME